MTEQQVKDKVRAVLALMKPECQIALYDKWGWKTYEKQPVMLSGGWSGVYVGDIDDCFGIPPYPGDWRESLVGR